MQISGMLGHDCLARQWKFCGWNVALLGILSMYMPCAFSGNSVTPPNWPWKGVVLEGPATAEDIKRLASYGINTVAILLSPRFLSSRQKIPPEQVWQNSLNYADVILDACKENGVAGILSISQIPIDPSVGLTQESREFWENPVRLREAKEIARSLAQHFHNRGPELAAYELLNEPLMRDGNKVELPTAWPNLRRDIVKEIRKFDAKRFVVVTLSIGSMPSGYETKFRPLGDKRIIYNAHMYMPHAYSHQGISMWKKTNVTYPDTIDGQYWDSDALENVMSPLIEFQKRFSVPVLIGEFSAIRWAPNSDQYLTDLINLFDKHGFGWMYFSFKGYPGWNPSCDTNADSSQCAGEDTPRWNVLKHGFLKAH